MGKRTKHSRGSGEPKPGANPSKAPRTTASWLMPMVVGGAAIVALLVGVPMLLSLIFPDGPGTKATSASSPLSSNATAPSVVEPPVSTAPAANSAPKPTPAAKVERERGLIAMLPRDYTGKFGDDKEVSDAMNTAREELSSGKSPMVIKNRLTPLVDRSKGTEGREHLLAALTFTSMRTRDPINTRAYADMLLMEFPKSSYGDQARGMKLNAALDQATADHDHLDEVAVRAMIDEARALEARAADPEAKAYARFMVAGAQEDLGETEASLKTYQQLADDYPDSTYAPSALYVMSRSLQKLGKVPEAVPVIERLLERYPDDKVAKNARTTLRELKLVGQKAQPLQVQSWPSGNLKSFDDTRGKVVLVNFWQTWCPHCRNELPHMTELYNKYKDQGLVLIGATKDDSRQTEAQLMEFLQENPLPFPIARVSPESSRDYAITGIPAAALIDRQGTVVWRAHPNALPTDLLEQLLAQK